MYKASVRVVSVLYGITYRTITAVSNNFESSFSTSKGIFKWLVSCFSKTVRRIFITLDHVSSFSSSSLMISFTPVNSFLFLIFRTHRKFTKKLDDDICVLKVIFYLFSVPCTKSECLFLLKIIDVFIHIIIAINCLNKIGEKN